MTSPLIDTLLNFQREAQAEYFRHWERCLNGATIGRYFRDVDVQRTPHEVVYEEDSLRLLRYKSRTPGVNVDYAEPLLVCFALVNRPYILDLQSDRSVVSQFLKRGHDVYLIDWGVPTAADRSLRIKDYVCGFMKNVADFVCEASGSPQLNLLGYCMGGTFSTLYACRYPEQIRNLILMAAPIDFDHKEGLLNLWTDKDYFDVDSLVDTYGNCPGAFLQNAFQMMKPVRNYVQKYRDLYDRLHDDDFLQNFFAMERWSNDNIPVPGETFREFVKCLYQGNELVRGEFKLNGKKVNLGDLKCPLLLLTADSDHLVPPLSTLALQKLAGSRDIRSLSIDAGHIGLAVSRKAHKEGGLWPRTAMWLADRSTARR
ncbi:MAG: class III poly(R)-hydroxyalkanoic acid synthase subunit PhaC [Verrucomicrobia bacterium]|nr:class III poly(R)-hydroxyalkanoic acid synthase subunit PhaC [Verrucomicrobiota bacterium]